MSNPAQNDSTAAGTRGIFHYLDDTVTSSLYRNGRVRTRRDPDGSDGDDHGVLLVPREMSVHDARALAGDERRTLDRNGFELMDYPLDGLQVDFFDQAQIIEHYYPHCAALIGELTGGRVFAFDHNVRSAQGKQSRRRIAGGQQVQGPAHVVHGDYTLTSAPQRLRDLTRPPGGNDTLAAVLGTEQSLIAPTLAEAALAAGGRFAIINLWRSIAPEPVQAHPLALGDGQCVQPEDLVVYEIHYQDRIGENYFAKHSPQHRLYYYPLMTGDEALLIKQWDADGALARSEGRHADSSEPDRPCTFSFHSAFEDLAAPDNAPDRLSIEVRCMVVYG